MRGISRRSGAALLAVVGALTLVAACSTSQTGTPSSAPARVTSPPPSVASSSPAEPAQPQAGTSTSTPPPPNHCAGNKINQLVKVSISAQHLWLCAKSRTVLSTAITSGAVSLPYDSTPLGNFQIQGRDRNTVLTLNTGKQYNVKYWIPFSAPLFGFHDAPWQAFPFGSAKYKTQGSHGCIHMPLQAIAYLYRWAQVGASVHIRA